MRQGLPNTDWYTRIATAFLVVSWCISTYSQEFNARQWSDSNSFGTATDADVQNLFNSRSAATQIARPFDAGPNIGRSRVDLTPLDGLRDRSVQADGIAESEDAEGASYESILPDPAPPGRAFYSPASPGGIVSPITPSQAYEFDSYEGRVPDSFEPPAWCPAPFLWPLSNAQWTYIQGNGDRLGFFEFEKRFMFLNPTQPIRIIPGFMNRYVSGPNKTDLPADLAEISIEAAGTYQLGDAWTVDAGVRPSLNGDFHFVNHDTFRMQGHFVAANRLSPDLQVVLGAVYLAREDIPALPVVGFIWQPSSDIKWELVFPRPRLAFRLNGDVGRPQWLFLKGELGGNSWSIERASGTHDVATYRDIRLIIGYEAILRNGLAANFEAGWVFARKLSYTSGTPDFTPNDTFLVRAGLSF
jgi:hypothetical protein